MSAHDDDGDDDGYVDDVVYDDTVWFDETPVPPESPPIPAAFLASYHAAENARGIAPATVTADVCAHHPLTGWWLVLNVKRADRATGRSWAILHRPTHDAELRRAGLDLFHLVYPEHQRV